METPQQQAPQQTVRIERSVRINRLLLIGVVLGAVIAAGITSLFPVLPGEHYTLTQVVGFMAVLGAGFGLLVAALFALLLHQLAKRKKGTATAAHTAVTANQERSE